MAEFYQPDGMYRQTPSKRKLDELTPKQVERIRVNKQIASDRRVRRKREDLSRLDGFSGSAQPQTGTNGNLVNNLDDPEGPERMAYEYEFDDSQTSTDKPDATEVAE